ncbi:MAG: retroviral-like aspartic protease family protein, partial [Muribaculaceae bacterium]|nr:retroviral-like aspartic protease family protein [Muribaculaceae bacterium]
RETDAFKDFYNEHKDQFEPPTITELIIVDENGDDVSNEVLSQSGKIEVPFTPEHGCASVKCSINDLPLTFVFDTGASTVSISQLEANFMLKNGYLKRDDFVGTSRFVDANGDVSEGTIINLREVEFGGLKLSNVKASVVRNQKAPLLLGQSVLGRLGSIEIDNPNRKLIITR